MTAADSASIAKAKSSNDNIHVPVKLIDIFKTLAINEKVFFKSQQIGEDDLLVAEKEQIAKDAFYKNGPNFLVRFGSYLNESQLSEFQILLDTNTSTLGQSDEDIETMSWLIKDLQRKLQNINVIIKNRRFAAMQQLLEKGQYFSDHEMMVRAPGLYQEYVGQYMTDDERKQRDSYDVRNTSFSGILMHTLELKQREELLDEILTTQTVTGVEQLIRPKTMSDFDVPVENRKHWGGFDCDQKDACAQKKGTQEISFTERQMLRHEFMGIMKERFLSGEDNEFTDYTSVDENVLLDDLLPLSEQDNEEAYFEMNDDLSIETQAPLIVSDEECEDELDNYMRHINKQTIL